MTLLPLIPMSEAEAVPRYRLLILVEVSSAVSTIIGAQAGWGDLKHTSHRGAARCILPTQEFAPAATWPICRGQTHLGSDGKLRVFVSGPSGPMGGFLRFLSNCSPRIGVNPPVPLHSAPDSRLRHQALPCHPRRPPALAVPIRTANPDDPAGGELHRRLGGERAKLGRLWPHMPRHSCCYYLADKGTDFGGTARHPSLRLQGIDVGGGRSGPG